MFNLQTFTQIHVAISLVGIASGFVVMYGLLTGRRMGGWTALFLVTTVATSVTGFFFPFHGFTPAIGVGVVSLLVLAAVLFALYARHLIGAWRRIYVVGAVVSLYLNVFVLIVQSFQKIPFLKAIAPTQSELPFLLSQLVLIALFIALAIVAAIRFRTQLIPAPAHVA
jgi:hypothetical protein